MDSSVLSDKSIIACQTLLSLVFIVPLAHILKTHDIGETFLLSTDGGSTKS